MHCHTFTTIELDRPISFQAISKEWRYDAYQSAEEHLEILHLRICCLPLFDCGFDDSWYYMLNKFNWRMMTIG
jgi:hypothetical protein